MNKKCAHYFELIQTRRYSLRVSGLDLIRIFKCKKCALHQVYSDEFELLDQNLSINHILNDVENLIEII
jgi:hypothetical protein